MMRWFRASIEGSYLGLPGQTAKPGPGRRHQLQVYRAALRDLSWLDTAPEQSEVPAGTAVFLQPQIDCAHVTGVRGPGTWYEGPIFDVQISGVQLSHPTERAGRSYGRIAGSAVGRMELPALPVPPAVHVVEQEATGLQGTVYTAPADTSATDAAVSGEDVGVDPAAPGSGQADAPETDGDTTLGTSPRPRASRLLPVVAFVVLLGLGVGVMYGAFYLSMWILFMLPTLTARRFFTGVMRDSAFLRGVGYVLITLQVLCVASLAAASARCAGLPVWAAAGVMLALFPSGLLPSAWPIACNAVGLAVVLATFARGADPRCSEHKTVSAAARDVVTEESARNAASEAEH